VHDHRVPWLLNSYDEQELPNKMPHDTSTACIGMTPDTEETKDMIDPEKHRNNHSSAQSVVSTRQNPFRAFVPVVVGKPQFWPFTAKYPVVHRAWKSVV